MSTLKVESLRHIDADSDALVLSSNGTITFNGTLVGATDSAQVQAQIDSAAVKLTGTQTIAGIKTFSDSANFTGGHLRVYNSTDSEEQVIIAEVSGGFSNGAGVSLRRDGTEMGRINADYFDGMTFHVTDGAGGAATQKARLSTGGLFVIGENETPYNLFSVRDSDMGFEVNPNASQEVRLNAYDRGASTFRTMALQANPVVIRPGGANGVDYTTIDADGIKFNGDTAAVNGLDDYEEGTWTPSYSSTTGSFSSITYSYQSGWYTKVGNHVTAGGRIILSAYSQGTASGNVFINLPFTIKAAYFTGTMVPLGGWTSYVPNTCYGNPSNANIFVLGSDWGSSAAVSITPAMILSSADVMFTISYTV